jgi:hypothetical protein
LLLAASGVVVGALLAGLLNGKWSPLELDNRIEWIWWVGVAAAASGIVSTAAAVYPRIHRSQVPHPGAPTYYGDVAGYKDIDSFRLAIEQLSDPQKRLTDQTFLISRIVQKKYVLLRRGMRFFAFAIVACTTAILVNIPLDIPLGR